MKTKAQKKEDQKNYEYEKQVAETIVNITMGREMVENLARSYFDYALDAAKMGQSSYADELLANIVDLEDFASDLKATELDVRTTAVMTSTMAKLGRLPEAFATLEKIFKQTPNFQKVGANITTLREQLKKQREEFKEFRKAFGRSEDAEVAKIFGASHENGFTDRLQAKKRELEARLMSETVTSPVSNPAVGKVTSQDVAKVDAIAAMLDEETR
jgi:tetratricopeptide (TPR) repeat protein